MLDLTIEYFAKRPTLKYEIIIINDGSKDRTWDVIKSSQKKYPNLITAINDSVNCGKGFAVRTGMRFARGEKILMLDADGETQTSDLENLELEIEAIKTEDLHGIAIGSRNHLTEGITVERSFVRKMLMLINNLFVKYVAGVSHIKDTQCGFKLFYRKSAKVLFSNLHLNRWAFDVEMLYIAQQ